MTRPQASTRVDWQKIIAAIVLLLVVGYVVGRPALERWLGLSLPSLGVDSDEPSAGRNNDRHDQPPVGRDSSRSGLPPDRESRGGVSQSGDPAAPATDFFQPAGGRRLRSPAGLVYGVGPGGEHRCDHVREHCADDPSRPVHGVFEGTDAEVFALIDEAWTLARKGGRGVQREEGEDGRVEYTVRFDHPIGHEGGQQGRRNDFRKLSRIKLIIEDVSELITAYPVR